MKTKTIELYEFDELPKGVQNKILERERFINVEDNFWSRFILEDWEEKLKGMGFESPKIYFSGFGSQGDGASFTSDGVDLPVFLKNQKAITRFKKLSLPYVETIASVIRTDSHYSHENTVKGNVDVNIYGDYEGENIDSDAIYDLGDELQGLITEVVRKLSKEIYRELESEYDGLTSDEAVIDTIKANEYTFTASGRMENL